MASCHFIFNIIDFSHRAEYKTSLKFSHNTCFIIYIWFHPNSSTFHFSINTNESSSEHCGKFKNHLEISSISDPKSLFL